MDQMRSDPRLLDAAIGYAAGGPGNGLRIEIPALANIAADTVGAIAASRRRDHTALVFEADDGVVTTWTFAQIEAQATRLAAALARHGVVRGDRIAVHTGLRPETAISHMAAYKLGAIVVGLSQLYGPDTVRHVLEHSEASVLITQDRAWSALRAAGVEAPALKVMVGDIEAGAHLFEQLAQEDAGGFIPVATKADDPALLLYTSGSTGLPKGLLHGHRILHAYKPTVALFYNLEIKDPDQIFWTPSDWAWVGGLLDLLLPAWQFGQTVVTSEQRFLPELAFAFMARHGVTHTFMTPTALKRLATIDAPRDRWNLKLRTICTGGESLPGETLRWLERELRVTCNEFYGLTEVNHLIGNCGALYSSRPGSMGKAYPGHCIAIVDAAGNVLPDGEVGDIVASAVDPCLFLGYWKDRERTNDMRLGPWIRTGDVGRRDAEGYFYFSGRSDDLIKSAGYRIGPGEVENALLKHAAVAEAAVLGVPDAERGSIVKAFVRLRPGHAPTGELAAGLQAMIKRDLATYKQPRLIEFVEVFPLTSSGKINRKALALIERTPAAEHRS